MILRAGMRVRLRTHDDLVEEYGCDSFGDIPTFMWVTCDMFPLLGQNVTIESVVSNEIFTVTEDLSGSTWTIDCIHKEDKIFKELKDIGTLFEREECDAN